MYKIEKGDPRWLEGAGGSVVEGSGAEARHAARLAAQLGRSHTGLVAASHHAARLAAQHDSHRSTTLSAARLSAQLSLRWTGL